MSVRVRFAPSPTGSLHLGSALTAHANRRFADENGGVMILRIDDTNVEDGKVEEGAILEDLAWLEVPFDEGPVLQTERAERHREAAGQIGKEDDEGAIRFGRVTLLRPDGRPTYHLASVVDDVDLGVTHVIRGKDHLPNQALHEAIARALGAVPPEFIHHGLLVGEDGRKLSKREGASSIAELRERGVPPEAVRAYLDELGLPRGNVRFDERRLGRLAVEAISALTDEELAARAGVEPRLVGALRGSHNLVEARDIARSLLEPPAAAATRSPQTLDRFAELRAGAPGDIDAESAKSILRELKAVGGDLRALRVALTGAERGPELWTILVALPREEALRRAAAARG